MAKVLNGQIGSNPPRLKPTRGRSDAPKWPIWRVARPLDGYLTASTDEDFATIDFCHRLLRRRGEFPPLGPVLGLAGLRLPPLARGLARATLVGAARAPPLAAVGDPVQNPLQALAHRLRLLQEQPFQMAGHRPQAVLEVRQHRRTTVPVGPPPEGLLAVVGAQSRQGDQREMGVQFLLDQALALSVELLQLQTLLGRLVQCLDSPAAVVQLGEVPPAVLTGAKVLS